MFLIFHAKVHHFSEGDTGTRGYWRKKNDENVTCGQEVGREALSKSGLFSEKHTFWFTPKKLNIKLLKCHFLLQKHIYLNMPSALEGINKYRFFYKQMQTESWN